jgi:hypothetical protein
MTAPLDLRFFSDGRPYLNAWQAALYVGYDVQAPESTDRAVRSFLEWARQRGMPTLHRGRRVLFRRVDLDRALAGPVAEQKPLENVTALEQYAIRLARGEVR